MQQPYIGITGFTQLHEVAEILRLMPYENTHLLMVGVLVNGALLRLGCENTNKRFAKTKNIKDIFIYNPKVLNIIHYCNSSQKNMFSDLERLIEISGPNLHGFQLNMRWPNISILKEFKEKYPRMKIVLQIERNDFDELSSDQMAIKLNHYINLAEYVILDTSMGAGIQMDTNLLISYANAIKNISNLNIVFAGGLCAKNISIIKPIIELFPSASIDAEGQLMDTNGALDMQKTCNYLQAALKMFQK